MTKTLYVPEYLKNQLEKNKPQTDDLKLKERGVANTRELVHAWNEVKKRKIRI